MSTADPFAGIITPERCAALAALPEQAQRAMLAAASKAAAAALADPADQADAASAGTIYAADQVPAHSPNATGTLTLRPTHLWIADAERLAVTAAKTMARRIQTARATDAPTDAETLATDDQPDAYRPWQAPAALDPAARYATSPMDHVLSAAYGDAGRWAETMIRAGGKRGPISKAGKAQAAVIRDRLRLAGIGRAMADGKTMPEQWTERATATAVALENHEGRRIVAPAPGPDASLPTRWSLAGMDDYGTALYRLTGTQTADGAWHAPAARILTADPFTGPMALPAWTPDEATRVADEWADQQQRRSREPGDPGKYDARIRKPSRRTRPRVGNTGATVPVAHPRRRHLPAPEPVTAPAPVACATCHLDHPASLACADA